MNPTRAKVLAASAGAGVGAAFSTFSVWLLGVLVWGAPNTAASADDALAAVPAPVSVLLVTVLSAGFSYLAGYIKRENGEAEVAELGEAD
jgi:ABC-type multidrug transport system fused ATPase/permease subunit